MKSSKMDGYGSDANPQDARGETENALAVRKEPKERRGRFRQYSEGGSKDERPNERPTQTYNKKKICTQVSSGLYGASRIVRGTPELLVLGRGGGTRR